MFVFIFSSLRLITISFCQEFLIGFALITDSFVRFVGGFSSRSNIEIVIALVFGVGVGGLLVIGLYCCATSIIQCFILSLRDICAYLLLYTSFLDFISSISWVFTTFYLKNSLKDGVPQ